MNNAPTRFSVALDLVCVAAAVLIGSRSPHLAVRRNPSRRFAERIQFSPSEIRDLRHGGPLYGAKVSVAQKFGIEIRSVSDIVRGKSKSARVAAALKDEIRRLRLEGIADRHSRYSAFKAEERDLFLGRGRYRGLQQRVAHQLRVTISSVSAVVNGRMKSTRIQAALRAEMARVDREVSGR